MWQIEIARTRQPLATRVQVAHSFARRLIGLLGRTTLPKSEALMFPRCNSIHTIGMRMPIDIVFVDRSLRVVALKTHVGAGQVLPPVKGAWGVIELASGRVSEAGLRDGDELNVFKINTLQNKKSSSAT
jgi:uncharacterized membrane protein (UPF0127 family)